MDGITCLGEIKNMERLRSIPVIMYSTSLAEGEKTRCYNLGAKCFLHKPNSFDKLKNMIRAIIDLGQTKFTPVEPI